MDLHRVPLTGRLLCSLGNLAQRIDGPGAMPLVTRSIDLNLVAVVYAIPWVRWRLGETHNNAGIVGGVRSFEYNAKSRVSKLLTLVIEQAHPAFRLQEPILNHETPGADHLP